MTLTRILNTNGDKLPVCAFPSSLLSTRRGLEMFLRMHATRIYGSEGKDFRVCANDHHCLVPLYVNQIVTLPDGRKDYGESLVVE